jgi:hypothetical protein
VPPIATAGFSQRRPVIKTLSIALVAATLISGIAPALADDSADTPSYQEQMTSMWIATREPAYARLAGLSDKQISEASHMPAETGNLN